MEKPQPQQVFITYNTYNKDIREVQYAGNINKPEDLTKAVRVK
jgi:hypothetical protein